jgi:lysozyme family protein
VVGVPVSGFEDAIAYVFGEEGGLADHPDDRGGRTLYGITTLTWEDWRDRLGKPGTPVDACTPDDARVIYHRGYWLECKCDALPWPVSLCVFDAAVQHGPEQAAKLLQRALGVRDDGKIGPMTQAAVGGANVAKLVRALIRMRLLNYRAVLIKRPDQRVFGPGWIGRAMNLWARCIRDMPEAA